MPCVVRYAVHHGMHHAMHHAELHATCHATQERTEPGPNGELVMLADAFLDSMFELAGMHGVCMMHAL